MARSLDQIMQSIDSIYAPQRDTIQSQINALPAQADAQIQGLNAAKTNAFSDITAGANNRGVVYSGIPIAEQARYVGEKYLPALAGVQQAQTQQQNTLLGALQNINQDKYKYGQSIYQQELDRDAQAAAQAAKLAEEQRQFNAQMALSRAKATAKAPSAADIRASLNQDIYGAFQDFKGKPKYYTEDKILKDLYRAYPELNPQDIAKNVYAFRKTQYGF